MATFLPIQFSILTTVFYRLTASKKFYDSCVLQFMTVLTSKKMSAFEMVQQAMDIRYPRTSPVFKSSPTTERDRLGTHPSPLSGKPTRPCAIHKPAPHARRDRQTWLDHSISFPASSSPALTTSDEGLASFDASAGKDLGTPHRAQEIGNSPKLQQSLHLSERAWGITPSPHGSSLIDGVGSEDADIDDLFDGDIEDVDASGLTYLTESSLQAAELGNATDKGYEPSMSGALALETLDTNAIARRHPGDLFLQSCSLGVNVRDFAYESGMRSLAEQSQYSPTESELMYRNFEFHNALSEKEQWQRFHNREFHKALLGISPGVSRKKQYRAWNTARTMQHNSPQDCTDPIISNVQRTERSYVNTERPEQDRRHDFGFKLCEGSEYGSEADNTSIDVNISDMEGSQPDPGSTRMNQLLDHMEIDEPQSAAMEISPIEHFRTPIVQQATPIFSRSSEICDEFESLSQLPRLEPQSSISHPDSKNHITHNSDISSCLFTQTRLGSKSHLQTHTIAQSVHSISCDLLSTSKRSMSPSMPSFEIHRDESSSVGTAQLNHSSSSSPNGTSPKYAPLDSSKEHRIKSSLLKSPVYRIRQSIEREVPHEYIVRESTPACEDRSPSPSPASRIGEDPGMTNSSIDIDMLDVLPQHSDRQGSMPPPPSPVRNVHNIQREYNLPSSSPDALLPNKDPAIQFESNSIDTCSQHSCILQVTPNPTPTNTPIQYQQQFENPCMPIPAPPPIPSGSSPLKFPKRIDRRKSGTSTAGNKQLKNEISRSITGIASGAIVKAHQQQQQPAQQKKKIKPRVRSRKVTQAKKQAVTVVLNAHEDGGSSSNTTTIPTRPCSPSRRDESAETNEHDLVLVVELDPSKSSEINQTEFSPSSSQNQKKNEEGEPTKRRSARLRGKVE